MKNLQLFLELASERAQALKDRQDKFQKPQKFEAGAKTFDTTDVQQNVDAEKAAKAEKEQLKKEIKRELATEELGTGLTIKGPVKGKGTVSSGERERQVGKRARMRTERDPNTGKLTRTQSSYNMKKKDSSGSTSGQYPNKSITTSKRTELPTVTDPEGRKKVKQTYADKVRAERMAAAKARIAAAKKSGGTVETPKPTKPSSKDVERQADQLLKKKTSEPKSSKPKSKSVPLSRNLDSEGNPRERSAIDQERNKKKKDMKNTSQKGYKEIYNDMVGKMSNPTNADRIRARVEAKKKAAGINAVQKG